MASANTAERPAGASSAGNALKKCIRHATFSQAPAGGPITASRMLAPSSAESGMLSSIGQSQVWKSVKPFVNGGTAGMAATCVIQPIDIIKVRIQLGSTGSPLAVAAGIIRNEGFGKLYTGLSAGLLRQATYTTTRLGVFNTLSERLVAANDNKPLPFWQKAAAGLTAGGIGAVVGSPADLSLIRMQTDGTLPAEQRRGYRNVGHALTTILREEGPAGLFTGVWPTAVRAMALNIGMLATNDQAKEMLAQAGVTGFSNTLGGSAVAGFFASFFSLPFDYMKTQLQKMSKDPTTGKYPYTGMLDVFAKTIKNHGPLKFYTGFFSYYIRIAPHAMSTLIFMDLIKRTESKYGL